jgi:hypothetical protein
MIPPRLISIVYVLTNKLNEEWRGKHLISPRHRWQVHDPAQLSAQFEEGDTAAVATAPATCQKILISGPSPP